jgi:hypothetical protein
MKHLLCSLLFFLFLVSCRQAGVQYVEGTIEDVFSRARNEDKKVFVLVTVAGCGQCKFFSTMLDSQANTTRILADDYICYKADIQDAHKKDIAQILKCPSYPFPYFFDKEGKLEAFGFPNSRSYDISDLSKINIDEYKFRELFHLPISTQQYKNLVSLNLRSYLLMKQQPANPLLLDSAYKLATTSMDIATYPYNIYLSWTLGNTLQKPPGVVTSLTRPAFTTADRLLYGNLINTIPLQSPTGLSLAIKERDSIAYTFTNPDRECGLIKKGTDYPFSFTFTNTGTKDLIITRAEHYCSCIEMQWTQQPVKPGKTGTVSGVFHATDKGRFKKDIYVHVESAQVAMKVISIAGIVD